eukprot:4098667-Pyramimonas_sp.AAC.1
MLTRGRCEVVVGAPCKIKPAKLCADVQGPAPTFPTYADLHLPHRPMISTECEASSECSHRSAMADSSPCSFGDASLSLNAFSVAF